MKPERAALAEVIESVADGASLDWEALEANFTDENDRRMLAQLKILARIAEVHRSLPDDPADRVIPTRSAKVIPISGIKPVLTVDDPFAAPSAASPVSAPSSPAPLTPAALTPAALSPQADFLPNPTATVATPAPILNQPIGRWGPLELLECIGEGTFGQVFRARDGLQREVAAKLLRPNRGSADRLGEKVLREARILARIRHSNVVLVHNAESHDGRVGLWMELIRGKTLESLLAAHGTFSAREAAFIGQDLCRALAAVHAAGLVHRDIKAQNVMREEGGRVVLMDFGAGQVVGDSAAAGQITGTPLYLAPEVLDGHDATVRSDIYSLGVLLYHLVTNDYPIRARSLKELRAAHADNRRVRLHDARPDSLPDSLVRVIEKATDPIPERRYATAGEMQSDLMHAGGGAGLVDHPTTAAPDAVTTASPALNLGALLQRPAVLATAALALLLVAALFVRLAWRTAAPLPLNAHTIAVLPLERGEGIEDYTADDVTDGISQVLSMATDVGIISNRSAKLASQASLSSREIAARLNADALVEGRLYRDGAQRLHLRLRLIRAGTDASFWSREFEAPTANAQVLQREAGVALAEQLDIKVPADRVQQRFRLVGRQGLDAQDRYARARAALNLGSQEGYERAMVLFREAIALEPSFAQAHAGLARAAVYAAVNPSLSTHGHFEAASEAARNALAIDDTLAEAHAVLGQIAFMSWQWQSAEQEFVKAIQLDPSNEYAREKYAFFLAARGRPDQGIQQMVRVRELDPLSPTAAFSTATALQYAGRYDEALVESERALTLDPTNPIAHVVHGRLLDALGRFDDAKKAFASAVGSGQGTDYLRSAMASADAGAGRHREALAVAQTLEQQFKAAPEHEQPELLAYLYARLGDQEKAFAWLTRAMDETPDRMLWLKVDPRTEGLRRDPRFATLLARLGLQP
jgi:eukaryotic-like serine/threonine-protein kinase